MPIRLRKSDGFVPTRLPADMFVGDPPVYQETLRVLMARDPFFLVDPRVEHRPWSALDAVEAARERGVAA